MKTKYNNDDLSSEKKVKLITQIIVGLGLTILLILLLVLWKDGFTFWTGITDYVTTSYIGAFIGGTLGALFAFLNAYLLYKTLKTQSVFNKYAVSPSLYFKTEKDALAKQNIKLFEQTPSYDEDAKLSGYNGFCFMMASRKNNR